MKEVFVAKNSQNYEIEIDEDSLTITVSQDGISLGTIELDFREDDSNGMCYYYICYLALDKCKWLGVGTRCLELFLEVYGGPLVAATPGSGELPDGSQLTGDGIPFIAKMREKGIVVPVKLI